ncbi:hypothetical protein [Bdellovibrio bacteriovorus]|uniref:head-tail joining protein n=1 Tax=Bdellovibrio bacteriovorus TaxID=959 RepID=UPI0035A60B63
MDFEGRYKKVLDTCSKKNRFGKAVSYLPAGAAVAIECFGVPSKKLLEVLSGNGSVSLTAKPTLGVSLSTWNALGIDPKEGDTLTMGSKNFKVKFVEPDGEGGAVLNLSIMP